MAYNVTKTGAGGKTGFVSWIRRLVESKRRKTETGLAQERINPLWNIDARHAQNIYDYARNGNFAQLQFLFNEIEANDPTLLTCVTRRKSALAELGWQVVRNDQRLNRNADESLVKEQTEALETAIAKISNLPDAVERLALAPFRGFAHVSPVHSFDGSGVVTGFDLIDNWNLCFDRTRRRWLWNGDATSYSNPSEMNSALKPIPKEELVSVLEDVSIDWPATKIYLRTAIGERDWGRFIETYGLPPVIITMPEFSSKDDMDDYMEAAESVAEGGSGFVPYGSNVSYAEGSRGTEPFSAFIEHNQKLLVLMATGGTLASLAESGSGTLAGNAQMDVWRQIVRRDVRKVGNAINKQLCEGLVRKEFKGKPVLVEFKFDVKATPEPNEVLSLAGLASSAGFEMDAGELTQATGFTIRKKQEVGEGMGFNSKPITEARILVPDAPVSGGETATAVNAESEDGGGNGGIAENAPKTAQGGVVNPPREVQGPDAPKSHRAEFRGISPIQALMVSLRDDFKPVADRLAAILALPDGEMGAAARELLKDVDGLVPDDPAMAEIIAEQMEAAFAKQVRERPDGNEPVV